LAYIEGNGMCLDKEYVIKVYNDTAYKLAEAKREIDEFTGGINPRSSKQVCSFLYDELKFPVPRVRGVEVRTAGAKAISKFKPKTKRQKRFLELKAAYSKVNAAMTKAVKPMYDCVMQTNDNVLYFKLNQTITSTHRLSSTGKKYKMQGQNIPRIYKCLFTARKPGWKIGEVDSGQLEFRAAVLLGQDKQGMQDIADGVDVHCLSASIIFEEDYRKVQEELGMDDLSHGQLKKSKLGDLIRQNSKENTFKPLYGGQSGSEREQKYYAAFREKYADITRTQENWIHTVLNTKQLRTITGLIFYWPDTKVHNSGYISNREAICNYPVQMFATADIMPIAVRFLWQLMRILKLESFMTNTIHDSAINEIHPDETEIWTEAAELSFNHLVVDYMESLYGIDFNVPLDAEIKVKDHWSYHPKLLFPKEKEAA
jgi:DNA polymerase I-like protein with 3'-5' exonuclease and polymerase domains